MKRFQIVWLVATCCLSASSSAPGKDPLPHQDVDLYLVQCNKSDVWQRWSLPADGQEPGGVQVELIAADPVDKTSICLNCAHDRCHGWTCAETDGNNYYHQQTRADGNFSLSASGKGDWKTTDCLTSAWCILR